jgi:predicted secreted protein
MAQAGFNGQLFIGTEGNGQSASQEICEAQDVTINLTGETFETSSRCTAPWKSFVSGWREWSVDFALVYENDKAALDVLETAFIAGTTISVRLIDKDGDGYYGDCMVTNWTREEPLSDVMTRSVTLQGTGAPTVINVAS